jgi:hypothetical protein
VGDGGGGDGAGTAVALKFTPDLDEPFMDIEAVKGVNVYPD